MTNTIIIASLLALFVLLILVVFIRAIIRLRRRLVGNRREPALACRCGYNLAGLDIPRCPECGRAIGFNKTFAELGVDEQQVMRHKARQRPRETRDD